MQVAPCGNGALSSIVGLMRLKERSLILSLGLFAALAVGASAYAQTSGAAPTVNGFYRWYVGSHDWTNLSGARSFLSPSLYAALEKLVATERREHVAMLDFDPFSGAQAKAASYSTGTPVGNEAGTVIPVRIRLSGGNGSSSVRVIVVHGASGWKIDNFVYPGMGNLRSALSDALK